MTINTIEELDEMRAVAIYQSDAGNTAKWDATHDLVKSAFLLFARAIREADAAAGIVSVPIEPTKEMRDAHMNTPWPYHCDDPCDETAESEWNSMISVSPFKT